MDWIINEGLSQVISSFTDARNVDGDVEKLRKTLPITNILMEKAEWYRFKDKNVDQLFTDLMDAKHEAEDLLLDFDYQIQRQKAQNGEGSSRANQILSSISNFAKGVISRIPSKVKDVQGKLDHATSSLENAIGILGSKGEVYHGKSISRETSSLISDLEVFGRDEERDKVIEILLKFSRLNNNNKGDNVAECSYKKRKKDTLSVLPIVGMGGIGKTTLAQLVYNDERVKNHFDITCWVSVSQNFDEKRLINGILESIRGGAQSNLTSLNALHENLRTGLMSKRFLIVLDDMWNENRRDWDSLCAPLRDGCERSMVIVTTRSRDVAEITGTITPIFLEGLSHDIFWEFLKKCAFRSSYDHPELEVIGKKIAAKLEGSPLAAKTIGALLNIELDSQHWNTILGSQMWKLKQEECDILPALQLSYLYLPAHLKRCFAFCSMFPKNYSFVQNRLVCMWVVHGLVSPQEGLLLEEIGDSYWNELIKRSFLQPIYPGHGKAVMLHDLMDDLARFVSRNNSLCIQRGDQIGEISKTLRHLSVSTPSESLEIRHQTRLHSLTLYQGMKITDLIVGSLLSKMPHLRMLILNACDIKELPESIGNLKHLRFLDLEWNPISELPESLFQIDGLQYLYVQGCPLRNLLESFSKLENLKLFEAGYEVLKMIPNIGKLTSLQSLCEFTVSKKNGHKIVELRDLNQLRGHLSVNYLENVEGEESAAQASLINKKYLSYLSLKWSSNRNTSRNKHNACLEDEKVLAGLRPHKNLKGLRLCSYLGGKCPIWLRRECLPCLTRLQIIYCHALEELTVIPSSLHELQISRCKTLKSLEDCLSPNNLPFIRKISIEYCVDLVSLPEENFGGFGSLEELTIKSCPNLICPKKLLLPSSLKTLVLKACCGIDSALPDCLFNLPSLSKLEITHCPHITLLELHPLRKLGELIVSDCQELECLGRLRDSSSLKRLEILKCPKLLLSRILMSHSGGNGKFMLQISKLVISDIFFLKSEIVRDGGFSCLKELTIRGSNEVTLFTGADNEILGNLLVSLEILTLENCVNLQLVDLRSLNFLKEINVHGCPQLKSILDKGLPSLKAISYQNECPTLKELWGRILKERNNRRP